MRGLERKVSEIMRRIAREIDETGKKSVKVGKRSLLKYLEKPIYDFEEMKIFNEYSIGAYLLYHDIPVFIDSRSDLYTKPFNKLKRDIFNDYIDVIHNLKYEEIFEEYGVTHVLFDKNEMLVKMLSKTILKKEKLH